MALNHKNTVLLLNVRRTTITLQDDGSDYLGLFYLAAVLEEKNYDPWVFHGPSHQVPAILEKEAKRGNIVAVGLTCDFENRTSVEDLGSLVKEKYGWPVLVGGPQAVDLGQNFFENSHCDYVVRGEAEETLPQLLDYLTGQGRAREDIAGIQWLDPEKGLTKTPDREPVADLDTLPWPAFHRSLHANRLYGRSIFTGRGCPFSCAFCYESNHKKKVRLRTIDQVMREIEHSLETYPDLKYLTILDDTFTLNPERVNEFCEAINKLRSQRELGWYCEGHVRTLAKWPEMMGVMADSGLIRLQIGVESGSQDVLDKYNKGITLKEVKFVVSEAVKAGIPQLATNLIIGGPLETEKTVEESAAFAEELLRLAPGIIDILTGFLRPYPCTEITKDPAAFGLSIIDPEGSTSFDDYPVMAVSGADPEKIMAFRRKVSNRISQVMQELLRQNAVPFHTILSQYRDAVTYGIASMWYGQAFKRNILLDEYFRLISKGAARRLADVPASELPQWRPLRTMEMRKAANFEAGYPSIGRHVLSPLELELILRCTGKLTFKEVGESLFKQFGARFSGREEFDTSIMDVFRVFEQRYWVVFCEL